MSAADAALRVIPCVGVVCLRGNEVLLVRRARPPRQGEWSIPGGRIEPGETAADAALRELAEETGVRAELLGMVAVVDAIARDEAGGLASHHLLVDYAALWLEGEPRAGDDAAAACWIGIAQAPALVAWPETARVIALAAQRAAQG